VPWEEARRLMSEWSARLAAARQMAPKQQ
jgi:hypothetical protein